LTAVAPAVLGPLDDRLQALAEAVDLADGRLPEPAVAAGRAVVIRAGERLGHGAGVTAVALAGPTGAGKSSLFNALTGADLVTASRRRPTTSAATAAVWGTEAGGLLDWLQVPLRHARADERFEDLVLLDLPDFDSVASANRAEADRLAGLVDLLVWVADPQKYADASLHERHVRPLAAHARSMVVVLNQADLLTPEARAACCADLARLLAAGGLDGVRVIAASARTGEGLPELAALLRERAAQRRAAAERLQADAVVAARALAAEAGCDGPRAAGRVADADRERLVAALGEAAGVPAVVAAVGRAHRRRGALAAGWPYGRWLARLRPDPLRRLRLGDAAVRSSLPAPTPAQRSGVDFAVRRLAAGAAGELPAPWPALVRSAAIAREGELADRLDRAVAGVELPERSPAWWRAAGALQLALALVAAAGALWLLALAGLGFLRIEDALPIPEVRGIPLPTLLLGGGVMIGLLLALLARWLTGIGAHRRARTTRRRLAARLEPVADELVLAPVRGELAQREALCRALARAGG
jgi:GTP-binding protein EngB required for normal cell division